MNRASCRLLNRCFRVRYFRLAVCLSVILIYGAVFFSHGYEATSLLQRKMTYGFHNGCVYQATDALITRLREHLAVEKWGVMEIYGELLDNVGTSVGYLGQVDQAFQEMEQLEFLEGTYPTKSSEVAMETALLDLLHIPYELGKEVTLSIQVNSGENTQVITKTYSLCGILDSYTTDWKNEGEPLCGAFVTQFEGVAEASHFFFYSTHQTETEMGELTPLLSGREQLVYNDYSYPTNNADQQLSSTIVLMATVVGLLFIVCVRIGAFQAQLYRMRILWALGMDRGAFRRLLYRRTLRQWAGCMIGTLFGCTIGTVLLQMVVEKMTIHWQFPWCWQAYALAVLLSCIAVLVGESVLLTLFYGAEVGTERKVITKYKQFRGGLGISNRIFSLGSFLKIQRRRTRWIFRVETALGLLSILVLTLCLTSLGNDVQGYRLEHTVNGADYRWDALDSKTGLTTAQVAQIEHTTGIQQVAYTSTASALVTEGQNTSPILMEYEDWESDAYRELLNGEVLPADTPMGVKLYSLPQNSILWNYYFPDEMNVEMFLAGKAAIVYLPEIVPTDFGYRAVNNFGVNQVDLQTDTIWPTVQTGDTITLILGEKRHQICYVYVMYGYNSMIQTTLDFLVPGSVLISEPLYMSLLGLDEPLYNEVLAIGGPDLSYDVSDKLMAAVVTTSQESSEIIYQNIRITREDSKSQLRTRISLLGGVASLLCVLTLIVTYRNRMAHISYEQSRVWLLRALGCEDKLLKRIYRRSSFLGILLVTVIVNTLALGYYVITGAFRLFATGSLLDNFWLATRLEFYGFPWLFCLLPQVIFLIMFYLILRFANQGLTEK